MCFVQVSCICVLDYSINIIHLFLLNILLYPLTVHMGVSTTDTSLRLLTRLEKPVDERKRVVCFFANNEHNYNLVFVSQLARDQVERCSHLFPSFAYPLRTCAFSSLLGGPPSCLFWILMMKRALLE